MDMTTRTLALVEQQQPTAMVLLDCADYAYTCTWRIMVNNLALGPEPPITQRTLSPLVKAVGHLFSK